MATETGTGLDVGVSNAEAREVDANGKRTPSSPIPNQPATGRRRRRRTEVISPNDQWKIWASRISTSWQKCVEGIVETGRLLIAAKADLEHGQFKAMVQLKLPFDQRTAQRLMFIASNPAISNATHVSYLPASWGTLHQLAHLPPALIQEKIESGEINSKLERKAVMAWLPPPPKRSSTRGTGTRRGNRAGPTRGQTVAEARERGLDAHANGQTAAASYPISVDLAVTRVSDLLVQLPKNVRDDFMSKVCAVFDAHKRAAS
jgi:hypothetical protein